MKNKMILISLSVLLGFSLAGIVLQIVHLKAANVVQEVRMLKDETEEYVYIAVFKDDPMIINHDLIGLQAFSKDYGVNVRIDAPDSYNIAEQKQIILDVIAEEPDGIMVCGSDPSLTPYVDMAIDAGIPTITVDADLPDSKRIAFVGSNFRRIGILQAETMVKLIGGKGIVAMLGMSGINMKEAYDGFRSVMENYRDVILLDEIDDQSNQEYSDAITRAVISKYPDIAGIAGFDSNSGPGIAKALEDLGLAGKVKVTCVDVTAQHIELLKNGSVQKLIGQKRELFTYYGGVLLYEFNHGKQKMPDGGFIDGYTGIPTEIDTGLIEMDVSNFDGM